MLAIEKRGRKRRFPERVDITTIIDMINVKNCLVQLGETISALRRQVQESVDASRESVDECQLFSQQSLLFQEEAIKALYMHPQAKRARIED
jgi:predicted component of type VI protein secretion system